MTTGRDDLSRSSFPPILPRPLLCMVIRQGGGTLLPGSLPLLCHFEFSCDGDGQTRKLKFHRKRTKDRNPSNKINALFIQFN